MQYSSNTLILLIFKVNFIYNKNKQIVRSVDDWSVGISKTEKSLLNAYLDLIKNAEHYIYIEVRTLL